LIQGAPAAASREDAVDSQTDVVSEAEFVQLHRDRAIGGVYRQVAGEDFDAAVYDKSTHLGGGPPIEAMARVFDIAGNGLTIGHEMVVPGVSESPQRDREDKADV
jgi:hypothetical protein